jgi:hypothetical protein
MPDNGALLLRILGVLGVASPAGCAARAVGDEAADAAESESESESSSTSTSTSSTSTSSTTDSGYGGGAGPGAGFGDTRILWGLMAGEHEPGDLRGAIEIAGLVIQNIEP